jgi:hypothetical protein
VTGGHRDLRAFSELTVIEKLRATSHLVPGLWPPTPEEADAFIERAQEVFPGSVETAPEESAEGPERGAGA